MSGRVGLYRLPKRFMAHPLHAVVRQNYRFCCGYCGVSESQAGGDLTVDHYRPTSRVGGDEEANLVYACFKCNGYKGGFWPNQTDQIAERRVLHPLRDDVTQHFGEDSATHWLEPHTATGRFHIALLQLNRPALVEHRRSQRLALLQREEIELLRQQNSHLRATISAQEQYISRLRQILERGDE